MSLRYNEMKSLVIDTVNSPELFLSLLERGGGRRREISVLDFLICSMLWSSNLTTYVCQ